MGMAFGSGVLILQTYFSTHLGIAAGLTSAGGSVNSGSGVLELDSLRLKSSLRAF